MGGGGKGFHEVAILIPSPSGMSVFGVLAAGLLPDLCARGPAQPTRAVTRRR